jgi:hypothetical protein
MFHFSPKNPQPEVVTSVILNTLTKTRPVSRDCYTLKCGSKIRGPHNLSNSKENSMLKMSPVLLTTVLAMSAVLPARSKAQTSGATGGAVFVMTNAANNNQIVAYKRDSDGSLEEGQTFPTGGRGSGGVVGIARCFNAERKAHTTIRSECG